MFLFFFTLLYFILITDLSILSEKIINFNINFFVVKTKYVIFIKKTLFLKNFVSKTDFFKIPQNYKHSQQSFYRKNRTIQTFLGKI